MGYYSFSSGGFNDTGYFSYPLDPKTYHGYHLPEDANAEQRYSELPLVLNILCYSPREEYPLRQASFSDEYQLFSYFSEEEFCSHVLSLPLHRHNTFELIFFFDGPCYQRIESLRHRYLSGSFCLMNTNVRHVEEFSAPFCTCTLSLSRSYLQQLLADLSLEIARPSQETDLALFLAREFGKNAGDRRSSIDFIPTDASAGAAENREAILRSGMIYSLNDAGRIMELLTHTFLSPQAGDSGLRQMLVCRILALLNDTSAYTTKLLSPGSDSESRVFSQITDLCKTSSGRVTRELLVSKLHYSGSYINRVLKKYTGMSITEYCNDQALRTAEQLLLTTGLSVYEIALEAGFSDRSYFYRLFAERYGCTPHQFRKMRFNP